MSKSEGKRKRGKLRRKRKHDFKIRKFI